MTERLYTLQIGPRTITIRPASAGELLDCLCAHGISAPYLYIWESGCKEWRGEKGGMYEG